MPAIGGCFCQVQYIYIQWEHSTTFQDFVSRFVLRPHRDDTVIVIVIIAIVRNNAAIFLVRIMGRKDNIVNVKVVIGL